MSKNKNIKYSESLSTQWLSWIARKMEKHDQSIFLVEELQITWLKTRGERFAYLALTFAAIMSILVVLMLFWYVCGDLLNNQTISITGTKLLYSLSMGAFVALVFLFLNRSNQIKTILDSTWSLKNVKQNGLYRMIQGGIGGTVLGLLLSAIIYFVQGSNTTYINGVILVAVIGAIVGAIASGWKMSIPQSTTRPNEGMKLTRRSAFKGLLIGFFSGVLIYLVFNLFLFMNQNIEINIPYIIQDSLLLAGILGYIAWLWFGGVSMIRHYLLRFILYKRGYAPWRLDHFLDYTTDRLQFTQRVGGGYRFIHGMLQQYFAEKAP